jgi:hypothetical protein
VGIPEDVDGISTEWEEEGTPDGVQLAAVAQSLLTLPFHAKSLVRILANPFLPVPL